MDELNIFYENHYKPLMDEYEDLTITHLNTVLDYEAESMLTCIENHILNNFYAFFCRYINVMIDKKSMEEYIKSNKDIEDKKTILRRYRNQISKLKKDILKNKNKCLDIFGDTKANVRNKYFPNFGDVNIISLVKQDPLRFLPTLIEMSIEIEDKNKKTFNCFPLRKNIIPKYIKLDTTSIIHILFDETMNKSYYLTDGNTILYRDMIWNYFFRDRTKIF